MALIAHWPLDGNARDYVGGYHGIEHGSLNYTTGKLSGDCLLLDGTANTGIELLRGNDATKHQYNFSFSVWAKSTSTTNIDGIRIISRDLSDFWGFYLYQSQAYPQDLRFYYSSGSSIMISDAINEGWNHIVATWDMGEKVSKLYINGELKTTRTGIPDFHTSIRPIVVGGNTEGDGDISGQEFVGLIDDIRAYNHVLSLKEIKEVSKAKILHYTFNTNEGNTIVDSSGFDNNGVNSGASFSLDNRVGSGCYDFTGSGDYINLNIGENFNMVEPHTFSMWVKAGSTSANTMFFGPSNGTNQRLYFGTYNGNWDMGIQSSGWGGGNTAVTTEWTHYVIVMTGSQAKMYINGNNVYNKSYTSYSLVRDIWIGYAYTTSYQFLGKLDDVRIYNTALSADDVKQLYESKANLDKNGNYNANFIQYKNWNDNINNHNLVRNGDQEFENNDNFSGFEYNSAGDYLSRNSGGSTVSISDYIPINGNGLDNFDQYKLEGWIKGEVNQSRYYFMIMCYDKNFRRISNQDVNVRSGTATTLTQDLVSGDEWVHLADTTDWYDDGTTDYSHLKGLALWHPTLDYAPYIKYKYTRRWKTVVEVDKANNQIRLRDPYSGDTIPSGAPAQNHSSGGTYSYIAASNTLTNMTEWEYKSALTSTTPSVGSMRYGTSYIKVGFLINRSYEGDLPTTLIKNIRFFNVDNPQRFYLDSYTPKLFKTGNQNSFENSELGPMKGIVAYYPLDGHLKDYSMNNNHATNDGAVISDGLNQSCYYLDGTGTVDGATYGANIVIPEDITNTSNYLDCTYSIWLNADTDAVDRMSLFFGGSTKKHIEIYSDSKKFRTEAATQNGYSFGTGNFPDNIKGVWSHFVIVFANGEPNRPVRWYQNGNLFHTGDMTSGTNPDEEYFSFNRIGRATGTTSYNYAKSFHGKIQDFRIYNRALSEQEIKILYDMYRPDGPTIKTTRDTIYVKGQFKENY